MNLSPRFLKTFFDLYSTPHFVLSITILAIAVYELPVNLTSEEKDKIFYTNALKYWGFK